MLLAIDIGNSHTVLGLYEGSKLLRHWRLKTNRGRTADEYGVLTRRLLGSEGHPMIDGVVVSSVVPPLNVVIDEFSRRYLKVPPLFVSADIPVGMPILYDNPHELGADRLVNAVAAFSLTGSATIVVDLGTATKVELVSSRGEYMGGAIAPGIGISGDALFERAARLHRVELMRPPQVIGHNTVHAIQAGLVFGFASLVEGLVGRMQKESDAKAQVIATGGFAPMIAAETSCIDRVDPFLTLDGLCLIFARNSGHGR